MRRPSILAANQYYQAAEMISLIFMLHVTISQRYHFTMFSVLADVYPISIERGQKMGAWTKNQNFRTVGTWSGSMRRAF
jgi:hypothetical protein